MGQSQSDILLQLSKLKRNNTNLLAIVIADVMNGIVGGEHRPHHVEEDSFELSHNGEPFAGGSFYVKGDRLILASVTPQVDLGSLGQLSEIRASLRNLK